MSKKERVLIWNSILELTREQAKILSELSKGNITARSLKLKGGSLSDEKHHVLSLLVLCNLTIEARANHLVHGLHETGKITDNIAAAAFRLPTKEKWFFLPTLAKVSRGIKSDQMPHQAIAQICQYRNNLIHVKYLELTKNPLPSLKHMLNLYNNFVEAIENMNVILKEIKKERITVLKKLSV